MRLRSFTDYGLRALILAGVRHPERVTLREIAEGYRLSANHLLKVVQALRRLGYLASSPGRGGGFRLALAPEKIRVGTVVRQMEQDFSLVDCMAARRKESCAIHSVCRLQHGLRRALEAFLAVLDEYTLADLVRDSVSIRALLPDSKDRRFWQRRQPSLAAQHRKRRRT